MMFTKTIAIYARNLNKIGLNPICTTSLRLSSSLPDVEFSETKYNAKRGNFASIKDDHISYFKSILDEKRVLTDPEDVLPFNIDWIKNCRGQSTVVLKPKTTKEVSKILKFCNDNNLAVCPQGGNTGLVGGSVPVFDEIVISMSLMNKVINIDEYSGTLTCEAGCILENLDNYLKDHKLMMPLDMGSKGTCQIGGNVSTNAGGIRLLRYGNLHGNILGVEAVKANGEIIDCLNTLKKDNTGYHLKHLFIGSEGTLGLITKIAIQCPVLPNAVSLAFLGVNSFESILEVYRSAKSSLGEIMSAFEMSDAAAIDATIKDLKIPSPIGDFPFYILIETSGSDEDHDNEKLNRFLEKEMESGLILDGTVTKEPGKLQTIWTLRENISNSILLDGYVFKYDVSLPLTEYYSLVPLLKEKMGEDAVRVCGYGHIGDGNIHINVSVKKYSKQLMQKMEPYVYEEVSQRRGSVSAEHGVGFRKPAYMHYSKNHAAISLMKDIKALMDPKGILNPYKVLPN